MPTSGFRQQRRLPSKAAGVDRSVARDVVRKLRVTAGAEKAHFRRMEAACGIGSTQVWMLSVIGQKPGLRVAEIAESLLIHQSTASNLLDRLVKRNLARKERSGADHRIVRVHLTDEGHAILARAPYGSIGILLAALDSLPPEVLVGLDAGLDRLIEALGRLAPIRV